MKTINDTNGHVYDQKEIIDVLGGPCGKFEDLPIGVVCKFCSRFNGRCSAGLNTPFVECDQFSIINLSNGQISDLLEEELDTIFGIRKTKVA